MSGSNWLRPSRTRPNHDLPEKSVSKYMYFVSCDQEINPTVPKSWLIQSDHFCVWKLKSTSLCWSFTGIAAMKRPSGDQRGLNRFSEPGKVLICLVLRSITKMASTAGGVGTLNRPKAR